MFKPETVGILCIAALFNSAQSEADQWQETAQEDLYSTRWTLSTDLLVWKAKEERLEYTTRPEEIESPPNFTEAPIVKPDFEWNYGFREKFAYDPWCGEWELYLQWTHIVNEARGHKQATATEGMFPVWALADDILSVDYVADSKLKWHAATNVLDAIYGYHFRPVSWLTLIPWAGLRSEWIDQKIHVAYTGGIFPVISDNIHMKNNFWGMGPVIGFNPEVFLGRYWSILVSADVAMLGGQFTTKERETYVNTLRFYKRREFGALRWNVDFLAALKWRIPFLCDQYAFTLAGGWESHWFFNQNQLSQNQFHLVSSNRDLTLQGWFFSLEFDF